MKIKIIILVNRTYGVVKTSIARQSQRFLFQKYNKYTILLESNFIINDC